VCPAVGCLHLTGYYVHCSYNVHVCVECVTERGAYSVMFRHLVRLNISIRTVYCQVRYTCKAFDLVKGA